jgi:hypothetical protein
MSHELQEFTPQPQVSNIYPRIVSPGLTRCGVPSKVVPLTQQFQLAMPHEIGIPPQDRLNNGHHVVDVLEARKIIQGLTIVRGRRRGDAPLGGQKPIGPFGDDALGYNPRVADVGFLNRPLILVDLLSVGSVMGMAAHWQWGNGSIRVPDASLRWIVQQLIPVGQVTDAAWIEVTEWRDDII